MVGLTKFSAGILAAHGGAGTPTSFQDSCVRANNTDLSASAPYTVTEVAGDAAIVSNTIRPVLDDAEPRVRWEQPTSSTNMYTQGVVSPLSIGSGVQIAVGVLARYDPSSDTAYWFVADGTNLSNVSFQLLWITSGTLGGSIDTDTGGSLAANDVLRIECNGTSIIGKKNGSSVVSGTDSNLITGFLPGVSVYRFSTAGGAGVGITTIEWGNL